jgi:hypothetical protein
VVDHIGCPPGITTEQTTCLFSIICVDFATEIVPTSIPTKKFAYENKGLIHRSDESQCDSLVGSHIGIIEPGSRPVNMRL